MTEKEKMLAGHIYDACNPEILSELFTTQDAVFEYNQIRPTDHALRTEKIKQILGKTGERVIVNQPFHCDYGSNISVGEGFFANFNLTVLDEAPVTIGDNCFIGPNVGLYTACHPTDPVARNSRQEWAEPITIGHNVWIGGGVPFYLVSPLEIMSPSVQEAWWLRTFPATAWRWAIPAVQ